MLRERDVLVARASPLGYATVVGRGRFRSAPHLILLNEALVECFFGPLRRLMVFMPPGHGKSTMISRAGVGWHLGTFPDQLVGVGSYEGTYAKSWGRAVREDVREFGDELFGIRVSADSDAADRWDLVGTGGGMRTAGIEGRLTGMRFGGLVIDDPIKDAKQAYSKTYRDACGEWVRSVVEGRLNPGAWIVLVLTRWHEDDLAGRLLREQPGEWAVLSLPALAEAGDALGRAEGAALWPAMFDEAALEKKRRRVGSYWWAAQYQQRPAPEAGNRVKRDWWRFWQSAPRDLSRIVTSVDCSFKETTDSSYVVIQAWGQRGPNAFLLDQVRERMDFPETLAAFEAFHRKHRGAGAKLVEDKANGPAVIATMRKKIGGIVPVEVTGKGSKVARLSAVSPFIEAGNVFLHDTGTFPWVDDYIEELAAFPNSAHDDQVDATSQALAYLFGPNAISLAGGPDDEDRDERPRGERRREPAAEPFTRTSIERIPLWGG